MIRFQFTSMRSRTSSKIESRFPQISSSFSSSSSIRLVFDYEDDDEEEQDWLRLRTTCPQLDCPQLPPLDLVIMLKSAFAPAFVCLCKRLVSSRLSTVLL